MFDAHRDDPEFGYRFWPMRPATPATHAVTGRCGGSVPTTAGGRVFGKKRAARTAKKPGPPAHDDLVRAGLHRRRPNQLWLTDITEHWTGEGKLYLCAIKDVYSNRIVGYSIDSRMKSASPSPRSTTPSPAAATSPAASCTADRGSQFRIQEVPPALTRHQHGRIDGPSRLRRRQRRHGIVLRAPPEERPDRQRWATRDELRIAIVTWIERTYHRRRSASQPSAD
jgi:putative transposase